MLRKNRQMSKKIDIVGLYLFNYKRLFSGREIARNLNVNHQTALNILKIMVDDHILKTRVQGRNILYSLNLEDFKVDHYLVLAETLKAQVSLENFELKSIIKTILPLVDTLVVFGSFAQDKQRDDSDLDLVAIETISRQKLEEALKLFSREINVHYVTWKEFIKSYTKKNNLALEIRKNHLIYGNIGRVVGLYLKE
jgi:predicted nucleotidyltransferase